MPVEYDPESDEVRGTRSLRRSGNSVVVSLPPEVLRQAGFTDGDDVVVAAGFSGGEVVLRALETDESATDEATAES